MWKVFFLRSFKCRLEISCPTGELFFTQESYLVNMATKDEQIFYVQWYNYRMKTISSVQFGHSVVYDSL